VRGCGAPARWKLCFTADSLQYVSTQPALVVIQPLRHAYGTPTRVPTHFAVTLSYVHTDPDSLPSFAEEKKPRLGMCHPQLICQVAAVAALLSDEIIIHPEHLTWRVTRCRVNPRKSKVLASLRSHNLCTACYVLRCHQAHKRWSSPKCICLCGGHKNMICIRLSGLHLSSRQQLADVRLGCREWCRKHFFGVFADSRGTNKHPFVVEQLQALGLCFDDGPDRQTEF